jgi:hypothetical protein
MHIPSCGFVLISSSETGPSQDEVPAPDRKQILAAHRRSIGVDVHARLIEIVVL